MMEQEPIDTSTPWGRPRREPLTQVEYERKMYEAMTKPGGGKIHPMSITTGDYEPNRAMVVDSNDIIAKKGQRQPGYNRVVITTSDKVVVYSVMFCLIVMAAIIGYSLTKLG